MYNQGKLHVLLGTTTNTSNHFWKTIVYKLGEISEMAPSSQVNDIM